MTKNGFADVPAAGREGGENLFGYPSQLRPADAAQQGYGDEINRDPQQRQGDLEEAYRAALAPADRARYDKLKGTSGPQVEVVLPGGIVVSAAASGCVAEARERIYGSVKNFLTVFYLPQGALTDLRNVEKETEVKEALARYEGCMKAAGYSVGFPQAARELAESYYRGRPSPHNRPAARELQIATSDGRCRSSSGLSQAYAKAAERRAARWIREHEAEIVSAGDIQLAASKRAVAALAGR
jgi:hypothetical protein